MLTVREVGPRDGLQMVKAVMPTAAKLRWIAAMVAAGIREMEVASFVPPAAMPGMADAAEVVRAVRAAHPALRVVALAPNLRGAQNAAAAGAQSVIIPVSASEAHSRANVRRSRAEQVAEVARVAEWARGLGEAAPRIEAGISTAFGCSLQGWVDEGEVVALAADLLRAGADSVALADTLGYATPSHVRRLVRAVRAEVGEARFGNLHLHDTLGTALANALAALEEGVRGFDAALGGLGGCPYAPGSVGNACTEDLVNMLESEGFATGIDLPALIAARGPLREGLPDEPLHGRLAAAGVPRTYRPAARPAAPEPLPALPRRPSLGRLPLEGVRVIEFSHMVMGPSCGMVLADLGADVIKVEPAPGGDNSRRLTGPAIGFFPTFNRNKRSLCVDMKKPAGLALVRRLAAGAEVVLENFRPGAMDALGLGWEALSALNPRLIYLSCKGFLPGPYEKRAALDEVVQMMGGLAYMTGPPGQPLRAGTSINDIMGGVFGAVAILAALREREATGRGGPIQSGLFETNMLLVAQHMAAAAITGSNPTPFGDKAMPKPWPVYDVFESAEPGRQVFVGVVTTTQWGAFCREFGLEDLLSDPALAGMQQLAAARPRIGARVAEVFRGIPQAALMARCEALGLPFAPIAKPADLFDDPHLLASGGLLPVEMASAASAPGGAPAVPVAGIPGLPVLMGGARTALRRQPPRPGEHGVEIAREAGLDEAAIAALLAEGTLHAEGPAALAAE
ncbi:hydroxymethylglutaryl-CoA lyase [Muricoccus pecuniae]|uniref:Crotonobetainyl-CoA:carnitine CoA-transferase CaiB-like acyl-CoA transferase n=1 Tax=Muricoccus pecuniae TaxID=693023 RepID=A0A840Y487_9PROT|nr:hydroxymethylglutaryl-CoA lyase [Roseomonas pecuniae]MBB5694976.1 crotonobetainyl-CoA:carnitine CoA-transferase CaiB-like acyl-CoA transferase [Roseomonas pecuniae]